MNRSRGSVGTPTAPSRLPKRERTRRQIVAAAIEVMSERGLAQASVQEIAARAGVTTGTFYNHFRDRADIVDAAAAWFSTTMLDAAAEARRALPGGAERMVDGCRRYLAIARETPAAALLVLELALASPAMLRTIGDYVLADVRLGVEQGEFGVFSEAAAVDLVEGYIMLAMRHIASRRMPAAYEREVVATVLTALGIPSDRALELASPSRPAARRRGVNPRSTGRRAG